MNKEKYIILYFLHVFDQNNFDFGTFSAIVKLKREEGGRAPPVRPPDLSGRALPPLSLQFYIEISTYGHIDGHTYIAGTAKGGGEGVGGAFSGSGKGPNKKTNTNVN